MPEDDEDAKLITLARGARGRVGAAEGAAVRDETGRTYSGASVALDGLSLTAIDLAVAQAAAAGARGLEAAVVVTAAEPDEVEVGAVAALGGAGVPVLVCGPHGDPRRRWSPIAALPLAHVPLWQSVFVS